MEYDEEFRIVEHNGYKFQVSNFGYCSVDIVLEKGYYKTKNWYKGKRIPIHILVAKAFPEICGEWFEGCNVHHINGYKKDNCAWNLICLSQKEHSQRHSFEHSKIGKEYDCNGKQNGKIMKYDFYWNPIKLYNNAIEIAAEIPYGKETILSHIKKGTLLDGYYYVKL